MTFVLAALGILASFKNRIVLTSQLRAKAQGVCSLLWRVKPGVSADQAIAALMATAPVKPALVLDVGLAHGKECFEIAEKGHICRGYEADPESAALVQRQAATHAQAHLLQIHAAAVGARNTHAVFEADRHNQHGVGGRMLTADDVANAGAVNTSLWEHVEVPVVRLDEQVAPGEVTSSTFCGAQADCLQGEKCVLCLWR